MSKEEVAIKRVRRLAILATEQLILRLDALDAKLWFTPGGVVPSQELRVLLAAVASALVAYYASGPAYPRLMDEDR